MHNFSDVYILKSDFLMRVMMFLQVYMQLKITQQIIIKNDQILT